jgi:hypothetical protein
MSGKPHGFRLSSPRTEPESEFEPGRGFARGGIALERLNADATESCDSLAIIPRAHASRDRYLAKASRDEFRLLSSRRSGLSETFLELLVGCRENEQSKIDVRPRIVSAIVPAARTQFDRVV